MALDFSKQKQLA